LVLFKLIESVQHNAHKDVRADISISSHFPLLKKSTLLTQSHRLLQVFFIHLDAEGVVKRDWIFIKLIQNFLHSPQRLGLKRLPILRGLQPRPTSWALAKACDTTLPKSSIKNAKIIQGPKPKTQNPNMDPKPYQLV
jgi:hypothetical protein